MALHKQIKNEIKEAMLKKERVRLEVLRGLQAAFTNELVATKRKPDEELSDDEALQVIGRLAKQRKDSIEQFSKGGREDLVKTEEEELQKMKNLVPSKKFGEPKDMGFAALYLASREGHYVNGTNIIIDGGRTSSL
ncbi:MAG: GatB/YqeY domain-containing protein [Candidatus Heimdallarchaeota archaeon]|nr:GatB/YqeY domain-containing protein [Candidatus Heimdallarchaeota archaeon]